MRQPKMLPCPFCGGPAKTTLYPASLPEIASDYYSITCSNRSTCPVSAFTSADTRSETIAQWNTRAPDANHEERTSFARILRGLRDRGVITQADVDRVERQGVAVANA